MAAVPDFAIKDAPIHWEFELAQTLGIPLVWCGTSIPPPTFAALALLELLDNAFIGRWPDCCADDVIVAAYVLAETKSAAFDIREVGLDTCQPVEQSLLAPEAKRWALAELTRDLDVEAIATLRQWVSAAFSGYSMIPPRGGRGEKYLFGAQTIARSLFVAGESLGTDWHRQIWDSPVCLFGHLAAARADANGVDGVKRPKDHGDIVAQKQAAREREEAGELHPWQIADPDRFPLTQEQIKHPRAQKAYAEAQEAVKCPQ